MTGPWTYSGAKLLFRDWGENRRYYNKCWSKFNITTENFDLVFDYNVDGNKWWLKKIKDIVRWYDGKFYGRVYWRGIRIGSFTMKDITIISVA